MEEFVPLTIDQLATIVKELKYKRGTSEGISSEVLKNTFETSGHALLNAINLSLSTGIFPDKLKLAIIIPAEKVKGTLLAQEFRPLNTLPIYEKVLEIAAHEQMQGHFEENSLLFVNQSGFRSGHSCETALQMVLDKWKGDLDRNKCIAAVFVDFKRAFETVDRQILLRKLEAYGIKGKVLDWCTSYLDNRKQVTTFEGQTSKEINVKYGVPQGSVLGPLFFIVYINDLSCSLTDVFVNIFADDTLVSYTGNLIDIGHINQVMNKALDTLCEWLKINKLKLNVQKTKCMLLTSTDQVCDRKINRNVSVLDIRIEDQKLDVVSEFKYLGILIDSQLKLIKHVKNVISKVSKKTGFLNRISRYLSPWVRLLVYKTIVAPHIDYCCTLYWNIRKIDLQTLQRLQNKSMRVILRCSRYTSVRIMLDALQLLSIEQRIAFFVLLFIYKMLRGQMPEYLDHKIMHIKDSHVHNTRNGCNILVKRVNKTSSQKSLFYSGFRLYNRLPLVVQQEKLLICFKYECVKFIKNECVFL
jgi:hypothetical protein